MGLDDKSTRQKVYQSVEDLKKFGNLNTDYPLSHLTISMGFFLVNFLVEISQWIITRLPDKPYPPIKKKINKFTSLSVAPLDEVDTKNSKAFLIEDEFEIVVEKAEEFDNTEENGDVESIKKFEESFSIDDKHENIVYDSLSLNSDVAKKNVKNLALDKQVAEEEDYQEVVECEMKFLQQIMRCILIVLALSFHAIFEGLAIGLQKNTSNIWFLFIAVCMSSKFFIFLYHTSHGSLV
ncbi:hypothetical protein JTB14_014872 [Gonioctena quinquepunctata]|nr:hypothetical protein JTB14_014872 [Gonioctena quinquepunctata]